MNKAILFVTFLLVPAIARAELVIRIDPDIVDERAQQRLEQTRRVEEGRRQARQEPVQQEQRQAGRYIEPPAQPSPAQNQIATEERYLQVKMNAVAKRCQGAIRPAECEADQTRGLQRQKDLLQRDPDLYFRMYPPTINVRVR